MLRRVGAFFGGRADASKSGRFDSATCLRHPPTLDPESSHYLGLRSTTAPRTALESGAVALRALTAR